MTGTHYGIIPIGINNRMTTGFDTIVYPANLASNIAQGAATFAVAVKTKKNEVRQVASSAGITAVCGITEPALYGINMRFKTPLISACIDGACGGLFMGLFTVKNYGGGSPGLMTLPGYIGGDSLRDLILACIGAAIAFAVAFIISFVLYKDKDDEETSPVSGGAPETASAESAETDKGDSASSGTVTNICAPVKGKLVPLSNVNDPTFAEEILGKGAAVLPEDGNFVSPFKGTVQTVFGTRHAIGLVSDTGVELLIHVGLDTVNLNGKYYAALVKDGDAVEVGTPLLKVDLEGIKSEGYDIITPVIVTNTMDCGDVIAVSEGEIMPQETIIKVIK